MSSKNEELIDVRSLAQIVKSGDLLLDNPAETCIIFVSVIIVSAGLEYLLQVVTKFENKYIRLMVSTMTKELTIIGVLALVLMLASSLMPAGEQQERYSILFTWANMNLFFMACFFVFVVVAQFLWAAYEQPKWRAFEEGQVDAEEGIDEGENLWLRERTYKAVFDRYSEELILTYTLRPADCGLYEIVQVLTRRLLVNMSDLSWPVWLSLIPVIALNGVRAYFTPLEESDANYIFFNGMTYIAATGYFTMFVFLLFLWVLWGRLQSILLLQVKRSTVGAWHVPFGNPKRCIKLLQAVVMSLNWYVSLFATGMGRDILTKANQWQAAVMMILFFLPLFVVHLLLPWCINILAFMSVLGSVQVHQRLIEKVIRRHHGEDDAEDEDDDIDSEEEEKLRKAIEKQAEVNKEMAARRASASIKRNPYAKRPSSLPQAKALMVPPAPITDADESQQQTLQVEAKQRPAWMDEDDEWEADNTPAGTAKIKARDSRRTDPLFFEHMDNEDLRDAVVRHNPFLVELPSAESKSSPSRQRNFNRNARMPEDRTKTRGNARRPSWLEDDEAWP